MQLAMPKPSAPSRLRFFAIAALLLAAAAFAALYWHVSGRLSFTGSVESPVLLFSPDIPGTVGSVLVAEGDTVRPGQELLRLEDAALRTALAREREKLAALEAALPPSDLRGASSSPAASAAPSMPEAGESHEQRLVRLANGEEQARLSLQLASSAEAAAALAYNRMKIFVSQGRPVSADLENARRAHEAAAQRLEAAKRGFERQSLARAAAEAELSRDRETRQRAQAGAIPANMRVAAYEAQLAATRQAAADLSAAVLRTPLDGVVASVAVRPGDAAAPGQPLIHVFPTSLPATVTARVSAADAAKLKPGQPCTVAISPHSPFAGHIRSVAPRIARPGMNATSQAEFDRQRMQVRILLDIHPSLSGDAAGPLLLADGAQADVTVHLREPLRSETAPEHPAKEETAAPAVPEPSAAPNVPVREPKTAQSAPEGSSGKPAAAPAVPEEQVI